MPFLNYMSILAERIGSVHVRVGGNTQDFAYVVDTLEDGKMMEKDKSYLKNPVSLAITIQPDLPLTLSESLKDRYSHSCTHHRLLLHARERLFAREH